MITDISGGGGTVGVGLQIDGSEFIIKIFCHDALCHKISLEKFMRYLPTKT